MSCVAILTNERQITTADSQSPMTRIEALAEGSVSLIRMGEPLPTRLGAYGMCRLRDAIDEGYLVARANEVAIRHLYSFYCDKAHAPEVLATPRTKYGTISFDMLPSGRRLAPAAVNSIVTEFAAYRVDPGSSWTIIDRVPIADVARVAKRLAALGISGAVARP